MQSDQEMTRGARTSLAQTSLERESARFLERKDDEIYRHVFLHRRWLAHQGGARANFEFRDLSGVTLPSTNLSSALMTGVNLVQARLPGANLAHANLAGADLEEADLRDANLTAADLRGANLHRAQLAGAILTGADFSARSISLTAAETEPSGAGNAAILTEANFERALLCQARLVGCDLSGADLVGADLSGANLSGSILLGVDLSGARLQGSVLTGAMVDFAAFDPTTAAYLEHEAGAVTASYQTITPQDFAQAVRLHELWINSGATEGQQLDVERTAIPWVKMTGRNLAGARLRRCRVEGGEWPGVRLGMADLSYSNLSGLVLRQGDLRGVTLKRAVLENTDLTAAVFDPHPMIGERVWPSNLEGAVLRGSNLSDARLNGVIARRVDFTGCRFERTSIKGADLEGAKR